MWLIFDVGQMIRIVLTLLVLFSAACTKAHNEVAFRFCYRNVPHGWHSAESSVPSLEVFLGVLKSSKLWSEVHPELPAGMSLPPNFPRSLVVEIRGTERTEEAVKFIVSVRSADSPGEEANFAIRLLIKALQRQVASQQPPLFFLDPRSPRFEHVPYEQVTGAKDKLFRYVEL